jgi:hypothetical protein
MIIVFGKTNYGNKNADDLAAYLSSRVLLIHNNEESEYTFDTDYSHLKIYYYRLYNALMHQDGVQAEFTNCRPDYRALSSATWEGARAVYTQSIEHFYLFLALQL